MRTKLFERIILTGNLGASSDWARAVVIEVENELVDWRTGQSGKVCPTFTRAMALFIPQVRLLLLVEMQLLHFGAPYPKGECILFSYIWWT